jgi:hypothetical protein
VSQPAIRALLLEDDEADAAAPAMSDDERFLLRHVAVAAALVTDHADLYRALYDRRRREPVSAELREAALGAAETIATLRQSIARRQPLVAAAHGSPIDPALALAALDQLFYSFTLLTSPDREDVEVALDAREAEELLRMPALVSWLEQFEGDAG